MPILDLNRYSDIEKAAALRDSQTLRRVGFGTELSTEDSMRVVMELALAKSGPVAPPEVLEDALHDHLKDQFVETPEPKGAKAFKSSKYTCQSCGTALGKKDRKDCSRCMDSCYCSVACQHAHWPAHKRTCVKRVQMRNQNEENTLGDPLTAALRVALDTWTDAIADEATLALHCALKIASAKPLNKTHALFIKLAHRPNDRDPTTCFVVTEAAAMPHADIVHYLQTQAPGVIPDDIDLTWHMSQDGLNNFYGMLHAPRETIRCMIVYIAYGPGEKTARAIMKPMGLSSSDDVPANQRTPFLNYTGWLKTFRERAAISGVKVVRNTVGGGGMVTEREAARIKSEVASARAFRP